MYDSWPDPDDSYAPAAEQSVLLAPERSAVRNWHSAPLKRAFDLVVAGVALLVLLPVLLVIAAIVALNSPGPILFRQRRTGLNGKVFKILKFRTMTVTEDGPSIAHAMRNDSRVTKFGRFLRENSLDELPQLINVLRGDMSLVGPRPHALAHDTHYGTLIPAYSGRFTVRPGLTGLAQIRGLRGEIRELDCMARRVDADVYYAQTWSFRRDLKIILQTVPLLLRRENAY